MNITYLPATSFLLQLPSTLFELLLSFCSVNDLLRIRMTSKQTGLCLQSQVIWNTVCVNLNSPSFSLLCRVTTHFGHIALLIDMVLNPTLLPYLCFQSIQRLTVHWKQSTIIDTFLNTPSIRLRHLCVILPISDLTLTYYLNFRSANILIFEFPDYVNSLLSQQPQDRNVESMILITGEQWEPESNCHERTSIPSVITKSTGTVVRVLMLRIPIPQPTYITICTVMFSELFIPSSEDMPMPFRLNIQPQIGIQRFTLETTRINNAKSLHDDNWYGIPNPIPYNYRSLLEGRKSTTPTV